MKGRIRWEAYMRRGLLEAAERVAEWKKNSKEPGWQNPEWQEGGIARAEKPCRV